MIFSVFFVFILIATLCYISTLSRQKYRYIYVCIGVMMVLIAALRPIDSTPDTSNYEQIFHDRDDLLMEPTFQILAYIINLFSDNVHWLFLVYAILGISLKMFAIEKCSDCLYVSLLIYFSNYYLLHDLVQIRAGVASGFLLLSLKPLCEGKKRRVLLLYLLASLFHYSALVLFFLLFFSNNLTPIGRWFWGGVALAGYIVYFLQIDFFALIPLPFFEAKMEAKELARDIGIESEINVFNVLFLIRVFVFYYILLFYDTIKEYNQYISIELKIMALSLFCFPAFFSMPVFSYRLRDLFGIVDIMVYSSVFYMLRPQVVAGGVVVLMSMVLLMLNIFYNNLILI